MHGDDADDDCGGGADDADGVSDNDNGDDCCTILLHNYILHIACTDSIHEYIH